MKSSRNPKESGASNRTQYSLDLHLLVELAHLSVLFFCIFFFRAEKIDRCASTDFKKREQQNIRTIEPLLVLRKEQDTYARGEKLFL